MGWAVSCVQSLLTPGGWRPPHHPQGHDDQPCFLPPGSPALSPGPAGAGPCLASPERLLGGAVTSLPGLLLKVPDCTVVCFPKLLAPGEGAFGCPLRHCIPEACKDAHTSHSQILPVFPPIPSSELFNRKSKALVPTNVFLSWPVRNEYTQRRGTFKRYFKKKGNVYINLF